MREGHSAVDWTLLSQITEVPETLCEPYHITPSLEAELFEDVQCGTGFSQFGPEFIAYLETMRTTLPVASVWILTHTYTRIHTCIIQRFIDWSERHSQRTEAANAARSAGENSRCSCSDYSPTPCQRCRPVNRLSDSPSPAPRQVQSPPTLSPKVISEHQPKKEPPMSLIVNKTAPRKRKGHSLKNVTDCRACDVVLFVIGCFDRA